MKNNFPSLEKELVQSIDGYIGYQTVQSREKTDQRLREYLASEIKQAEKAFINLTNRLAGQTNAAISHNADKLVIQLNNLTQSLHKPAYNNSTFVHLNSNMLSQLYHYELQLKNYVDILKDEVAELDTIEGNSEINELLNHLFDVVDNLNQNIMEREFLLAGGDDGSM